MITNFWDERYSTDKYIFGTEPNEYFRTKIDSLKPGKILIPAAGEGRDAVYAARLGWQVFAFDLSKVGREKAFDLCESYQVKIDYKIADVNEIKLETKKYDVIAPIFFHLPSASRKLFYNKIKNSLKKGGFIILEAFNPKQIQNASGGPRDLDLLLTKDILKNEFSGLRFIENVETETILKEGRGHAGKADVVRFFAVKD